MCVAGRAYGGHRFLLLAIAAIGTCDRCARSMAALLSVTGWTEDTRPRWKTETILPPITGLADIVPYAAATTLHVTDGTGKAANDTPITLPVAPRRTFDVLHDTTGRTASTRSLDVPGRTDVLAFSPAVPLLRIDRIVFRTGTGTVRSATVGQQTYTIR
uniref:Putative secreted protein n=1 Tax=Anopheles darlingi TaxID=43151 RepID=A0A2M4DFF6_ANODA